MAANGPHFHQAGATLRFRDRRAAALGVGGAVALLVWTQLALAQAQQVRRDQGLVRHGTPTSAMVIGDPARPTSTVAYRYQVGGHTYAGRATAAALRATASGHGGVVSVLYDARRPAVSCLCAPGPRLAAAREAQLNWIPALAMGLRVALLVYLVRWRLERPVRLPAGAAALAEDLIYLHSPRPLAVCRQSLAAHLEPSAWRAWWRNRRDPTAALGRIDGDAFRCTTPPLPGRLGPPLPLWVEGRLSAAGAPPGGTRLVAVLRLDGLTRTFLRVWFGGCGLAAIAGAWALCAHGLILPAVLPPAMLAGGAAWLRSAERHSNRDELLAFLRAAVGGDG